MGNERIRSQKAAQEPDEQLWLRVERAHRQIRHIVALESAEGGSLSRTRALLETFPDLLREHFADEERPNGLFDSLRAVRPDVDFKLKFLEQEHREILQAVEELRRLVEEMEQLEEPEARELHLAQIQERTAVLMRRVRHHELAESRLVVDIDYMEEGGSG
jgi:hypothetical protein